MTAGSPNSPSTGHSSMAQLGPKAAGACLLSSLEKQRSACRSALTNMLQLLPPTGQNRIDNHHLQKHPFDLLQWQIFCSTANQWVWIFILKQYNQQIVDTHSSFSWQKKISNPFTSCKSFSGGKVHCRL